MEQELSGDLRLTVWRDQYKKITSRLLAMQHLRPPVSTVQRMAGREREVVPAFTEGDGHIQCIYKNKSKVFVHKSNNQHSKLIIRHSGDSMCELSTASVDVIKAWKAEKHLGSPTSILFFTQEQLRLWDEKKVLLMADYSTGCLLVVVECSFIVRLFSQTEIQQISLP